jgi:hypothetical protein
LDAAGIRKRAATKGDAIVEVKPGEAVTSVIVAWTVERFVKIAKAVEEKPEKAKKEGKKKEAGKKMVAKKPVKKVATKKASKPAKKVKAKPVVKKKK